LLEFKFLISIGEISKEMPEEKQKQQVIVYLIFNQSTSRLDTVTLTALASF